MIFIFHTLKVLQFISFTSVFDTISHASGRTPGKPKEHMIKIQTRKISEKNMGKTEGMREDRVTVRLYYCF
jgi:hypothetical protein